MNQIRHTGGDTGRVTTGGVGTGGGVVITAGDAVLLLFKEAVLCLFSFGDDTGVGCFEVI